MKQQFLASHTIHQTEICRIAGHLGLLSEMLWPQKKTSNFFYKNITCISVGLLMIYQGFLNSVKLCFGRLLTNLCFIDYLSK